MHGFKVVLNNDIAPIAATKYASTDGHFGPSGDLAAYDFLFMFTSNRGSISLGFPDIDHVSFSS